MGRTRVRSRELERPEGPHLNRLPSDVERSEDVDPVAGKLLRLQQAGGNEAVGTMLAQREAVPMDSGTVAREGEAVSSTLVAEDTVGVIPLISFSRSSADGDVSVVLPSTSLDTKLMEMCAKGISLGTVKISMKNFTLTLEDVYISSCQPEHAPATSRCWSCRSARGRPRRRRATRARASSGVPVRRLRR